MARQRTCTPTKYLSRGSYSIDERKAAADERREEEPRFRSLQRLQRTESWNIRRLENSQNPADKAYAEIWRAFLSN